MGPYIDKTNRVRSAVNQVASEHDPSIDLLTGRLRGRDSLAKFNRNAKKGAKFKPTVFAPCVLLAPGCHTNNEKGTKAANLLFGDVQRGHNERPTWLEVKFGTGTQLPCIALKAQVTEEKEVTVYIFGTHLSKVQVTHRSRCLQATTFGRRLSLARKLERKRSARSFKKR